MQNYSRTSYRSAFTLMELMIVIVILGLLAGLIVPNLMESADKAKRDIVCVQMKIVGEVLDRFKLENGTYPTTEEGLQALIKNPSEEDYPAYSSQGYAGKGLPKDSWKSDFIYINNSNDFDLISLGSDRKEGGEDVASDMRFSECKF